MSSIAVTAIALVVGAIVLLFHHGSPLNSDNRAGGRGDITSFAIGSLDGSLTLPGTWITDATVAENLRQRGQQIADNGSVQTEVSARKGGAALAIVTAATQDPSGFVESQSSAQPVTQKGDDGSVVTVAPTRRTQVAGRATIIADIEVHQPSGELTVRARDYYIVNKGSVIFVRLVSAPEQADREFTALEQAFQALK
jgi:hypothetical protein